MDNNSAVNNKKRIITVIACLCVMMCVGILYLWSAFTKSVQADYRLTEGNAALVSSFMTFSFCVGNFVGGFAQDKTNPRRIALIGCIMFSVGIIITSFLTPRTNLLIFPSYSVLSGLGCGFAYGSVLSCLQKWFPTRRGFASGMAVAAFGLATVIFTPISKALIESVGVSRTFLFMGLGFGVIMIPACIFISLPEVNVSLPQAAKYGLNPKQAVAKSCFWLIWFSSFFINATWNIIVPVIAPMASERIASATVAGLVLMITGICNATGRLSMASLSDKIKRHYIMIAMSVITLICAVSVIFAQGYLFLIVIAFTAFAYGGPSATMPAMSVDVSGTKYSGTNYGLILLSLGFSSVIFNAISNSLKSANGGSMTPSFIMAACTAVVPIILMIVYSFRIKKDAYVHNAVEVKPFAGQN